MASGPILWVKSSLWFGFCNRRLRELCKFQRQVATIRPQNRGLLTCINMYLIRRIFTSPKKVPQYTIDAGSLLQFNAISQRFGMVFLQTLDLERTYVEELVESDSPVVLLEMGIRKFRRKKCRVPEPALPPSVDFPLGPKPTWATIVAGLEDDPRTLVREFEWRPDLESCEDAAALFVRFTTEYWYTIRGASLAEGEETPRPHCLRDAMNVWTIANIQRLFDEPSFLAVKSHWTMPNGGVYDQSFAERRKTFFVPVEHDRRQSSVWNRLCDVEGYIDEYHHKVSDGSSTSIERLHDALDAIFRSLECLPMASLCTRRSNGTLWSTNATGTGPKFVANPRLYKIEAVGTPRDQPRGKVMRLMAPERQVSAQFLAAHDGMCLADAMRCQRKKARKEGRRSTRAKNRRMPPRRPKHVSSDSGTDDAEPRNPFAQRLRPAQENTELEDLPTPRNPFRTARPAKPFISHSEDGDTESERGPTLRPRRRMIVLSTSEDDSDSDSRGGYYDSSSSDS
jgi:hypothetical protein